VLALLAAGCEDSQQHAARIAVQRAAPGAQGVHCTRDARVAYLQAIPTKVFVCLAHRSAARCDRYLVLRRGTTYTVRVQRRDVDCVLPG
jgi:hypothetical protein